MPPADKLIRRFSAVLQAVISFVRAVTSTLGPEDDWVEALRRRLAVGLHPFTAPFGRPLVFEAHEEDRICTVSASPDGVERALATHYQRNFSSTRKYRVVDGHRQWAAGAWVDDPDDTRWQHHVYLFENPDGGTDVYGHKEISAEKDPHGHVTGRQIHGDPDGRLVGVLDSFETVEE